MFNHPTIVAVQEKVGDYVRLRGGYELYICPGCRFVKSDGTYTLEAVSVGIARKSGI